MRSLIEVDEVTKVVIRGSVMEVSNLRSDRLTIRLNDGTAECPVEIDSSCLSLFPGVDTMEQLAAMLQERCYTILLPVSFTIESDGPVARCFVPAPVPAPVPSPDAPPASASNSASSASRSACSFSSSSASFS